MGGSVKERDLSDYLHGSNDPTTPVMCHFLIARIKNPPPGAIDEAVRWTSEQKGVPYQHWSLTEWTVKKNETPYDDPDSIGFYCSELVWAAYYYYPIRIDIDNNEWTACPFHVPNVNMGCPHISQICPDPPVWILNYLCPNIFRNEILIDGDIIPIWKEIVISVFPAGSQVQLYNGSTVNIEDVQTGDIVASYDMRLEQVIPAKVTGVYCFDSGELTDDLIMINNNFMVTANHLLFVNNWWVRAKDVKVGDELLHYSNGNPQLITINAIGRGNPPLVNCYALQLDSSLDALASYFVNGVLVCV
ncbi:MAG: polymorphic toxin-type HINT domain-containing protein [Candidatus Thermoplasmatota archaeon]|jgi:hypothetical protein|nr:polymorphic toxin-type HINT domain-containing protein [Candidatus Thermoplasmatota archaeon]